jgi:uncharacterized lipoprotein YddW (UPF0748 family)
MRNRKIGLTLLALSIAALIILSTSSAPAYGYWEEQSVWGAWVSPDWFFPGTHQYNEFEVRQIVRKNLHEIAQQGINNIFVETFLRGYSIAAIPDKLNGTLHVPIDGPVPAGQLPLYHHLNWPFRVELGSPVDTLQIFIEEGAQLGINVHAWVHVFYWKMDNLGIVLPWHTGMTLWNDLLVEYLNGQKKLLESKSPPPAKTIALLRECSELFGRTYDDFEFQKILAKYRVKNNGKLLGSLITHILENGGTEPDFILLGTADEPFPSAKNRSLGAIYLNPAHPKVQEKLISAITAIARSHRGLAGVHLDHIRYAIDYQGMPAELQKREWDTIYFNQYNEDSMKLYRQYEAIVSTRRRVMTDFVNKISEKMDPRLALSSAVLPANPPVPGEQVYFYTKTDFAGQDWYQWKVDFVVPMMYGYIPWRVRSMLKKWHSDLAMLHGDKYTLRIFPGVSHLQKAKLGLLDLDTWVFFDLTLARDVRFERKLSDDVVVPREDH